MWSAPNPQVPTGLSHCSHSGQCVCSHRPSFAIPPFKSNPEAAIRSGPKITGSQTTSIQTAQISQNECISARLDRHDAPLLKLVKKNEGVEKYCPNTEWMTVNSWNWHLGKVTANSIVCLHSRAEYATGDWLSLKIRIYQCLKTAR